MPESDWGRYHPVGLAFALAFSAIAGLWLWSGASSQEASYKTEAQDRADDYAHAARTEAQNACIAAKAPQLAECVQNRTQDLRPEQRQEYDLEAQRIMAAWTRAMGIAAIIGMAVSILGVGLIFVTFQETRRAANEANRTANEAEKTRLAYVARERGHLRFSRTHANIAADPPLGERLTVWLVFENIGVSVAEIVSISFDIGDSVIWSDDIPEPERLFQIKIPNGTLDSASFKIAVPVSFPCVAWGFVGYTSVGPQIFRSHFAVKIERHVETLTQREIVAEKIEDIWMPHDT